MTSDETMVRDYLDLLFQTENRKMAKQALARISQRLADYEVAVEARAKRIADLEASLVKLNERYQELSEHCIERGDFD